LPRSPDECPWLARIRFAKGARAATVTIGAPNLTLDPSQRCGCLLSPAVVLPACGAVRAAGAAPLRPVRAGQCLLHHLSHCVSLTVSPTVSPSLSLSLRLSHRLSLTVSPTASLSPSLPLCLPHRLSPSPGRRWTSSPPRSAATSYATSSPWYPPACTRSARRRCWRGVPHRPRPAAAGCRRTSGPRCARRPRARCAPPHHPLPTCFDPPSAVRCWVLSLPASPPGLIEVLKGWLCLPRSRFCLRTRAGIV
jgi:hypothetical protein